MFTVENGKSLRHLELKHDEAPPNVKKGENAWDAQDKIFRHIEDHLFKHLEHAAQGALEFVKNEKIAGLLIGGHRPLFGKIEKHLKYPLSKKVRATFVTELKLANEDILKKAVKIIEEVERKMGEEKLQKALA